MAKDATPEATCILSEFAANCLDESLRAFALNALRGSALPSLVDAVCEVWVSGRSTVLARLLAEKTWIADTPARNRVLTALKAERLEVILDEGPELIDPLVEACHDVDQEIASRARVCLGKLRRPATIDALCLRWKLRREATVTEALQQAGYIAQQPTDVRILTALKAGKLEVANGSGPEGIEPLLAASQDADPEVSNRAATALWQLRDPLAREALCRLVLQRDEPLAREAAVNAGYAPREPSQRALFYFLTEQWEAYEDLDFDRQLLARAYESGDRTLRCRVAEKGRRSGRTEWLTAVVGRRYDRRLSEMTGEEWEAAVTVLRENSRWEDLWQMAQVAPADWSVRLLSPLEQCGWSPKDDRIRADLAELVRLAHGCREEPPFLGRLLRSEKPLAGHSAGVSCLELSQDHAALATGSHDHTVRLWRLDTGGLERILEGHSDWVECLAISPDERVLASGSRDKSVRLWSWPQGIALHQLRDHTDEIRCLAFSPDGRLLASGSSDATIRLWSVAEGRSLGKLEGHFDIVSSLSFSPDGRWLATGSYDNDVRLWSLPDAQLAATLKGHKAMVNCVAFAGDASLLASGSKDRSILVWSLPAGSKLARLKGHKEDVSCLAIHPDSRLLASGSWDTTVRLWKLPDGEPLDTLGTIGTNDGHSGWVNCLAFSPDGKVLASGSFDQTARLWSVPGGAPLKSLEGHEDKITCLRFSSDGRTLVTGSADKTIRVWRSELARLRRVPIRQTTLEDLEWVENVLSNSRLSDAERGWMQFLFGLMRHRHRYDIEVGEAPRIAVGEFDIELEG
ncbi:MAG: hypothetical protein HY735_00450 [Verrucomicrobia bacterium]|nr:hypothetical protein [Verrucomicrobiota bacterium]